MARRSAAKIWIGRFAMLMAVVCCAGTMLEQEPDSELMGRQVRGPLLRSWRSVQQHQDLKKQNAFKDPLLSPGPLHKDTSSFLAGLPVSMKLVLLQRLTGHDKRTPNNKAFLGMRGKKNDGSQEAMLMEDEDLNEMLDNMWAGEETQDVPYYNMRDKKMMMHNADDNLREDSTSYGGNKKRAPSSNAFLGMRGKRSRWLKDIDYPQEEDLDARQVVRPGGMLADPQSSG